MVLLSSSQRGNFFTICGSIINLHASSRDERRTGWGWGVESGGGGRETLVIPRSDISTLSVATNYDLKLAVILSTSHSVLFK